MRRVTDILIMVLIAISWAVTIQLLNRHDAWGLIVVYWMVLTVKNVLDYIGRVKK